MGAWWFGGVTEARPERPGVVSGPMAWQNTWVMQTGRYHHTQILVLVT
jgi:hypothetical protein